MTIQLSRRMGTGLILALVILSSTLHAQDPTMVLFFSFDDATGPEVEDHSQFMNNGTLEGDPEFVAGQFGMALNFDATDDQVVVPGNATLDIVDDITMMAWIRPGPNLMADWRTIMGKSPTSVLGQTTFSYDIRTDNTGVLRFSLNIGGWQSIQGPILIEDTWYHVTGTREGQEMTLYLDGEPIGTTSASGSIVVTPDPLVVGNIVTAAGNTLNEFWTGAIDEVRIWNRGISADEVKTNMAQGKEALIRNPLASGPIPANGEPDLPRDDVVLNWKPGVTADKHNVYFGTLSDDVSNASTADAKGVLVSQGQDAPTFDPGRLEFDQTYYWRVDEVNGAPDFTVFKGAVWSFTAEPLSLAITGITATASSSFALSVPENTINGSGLVGDLHGASAPDMWISAGIPATIEYAFDRAYKLHELWVWNSNQFIEPFVGFGAKDVVIEHSLDGENWTVLEGVGPLAQAPGTVGYAHNNTIGFDGVTARHVRMTINSVQGIAPQASLSEVRFFFIPTLATRPNPVSGATDVAPDLTLSWGRNGREADRHEIYLGSDPSSLPLAASVTESSFDTQVLDLQLGQTYAWRVDEVNETEDPSTWVGDVWSFTTVDVLTIDDMESYRDEEFKEPWATWIDGFDRADNGSLVGANPAQGDFGPETAIAHGGSKSLPIWYDNTTAALSEATRSFAAPLDFSASGVKGLVLYFHGSSTNTAGRLYIKINDAMVVYEGDADNLTRLGWHKWSIPLAQVTGTDLTRVTSLTVGVDNGGQGVVYVDDILLTPTDRGETVLPVEPAAEGLLAHYALDGNADDSTGRYPGTLLGFNAFEAGVVGQALVLDGIESHMEVHGFKGIVTNADGVQQPFTVACWFKTQENGEMVTWGTNVAGQRLSFRINGGSLRTEHGDGNLRGNTICNDGEWHHGALTVAEGANLRVPNAQLYIDGQADGTFSGSDNVYNIQADVDVHIGMGGPTGGRFFVGSLDEVRIYERALSPGEVAGMAGRTLPFEAP